MSPWWMHIGRPRVRSCPMHVWVAPAVPGDRRARVAPAVPGDSSKHLPCQEMALSIALAQPPCRLSPRGSSPRQPCPHRSKRSLPQGSFHTTSPARNSSHSVVPRLPAASSLPGRDDAHKSMPGVSAQPRCGWYSLASAIALARRRRPPRVRALALLVH